MAYNSTTTTKSIDVGSMFLMDLSVNESDLCCGDLTDIDSIHDNDSVFPANLQVQKATQNNATSSSPSKYCNQEVASHSSRMAISCQNDKLMDLEYSDSSLNRLASAMSRDYHEENIASLREPHCANDWKNSSSVKLVDALASHNRSPSSISESLVVSDCSDSSASSATDSLSASYSTSSEVDEERGSATTREDSGVLDMKDLDSQLNNSYDDEHDEVASFNRIKSDGKRHEQENSISHVDVLASNLNSHATIPTCTANCSDINNSHISRPIRPTNNNSNTNHHNHQHRSSNSIRSVSASLPIQVPGRHMKKDVKQLKLSLLGKKQTSEQQSDGKGHRSSTDQLLDETDSANAAADDFDEFLEQEYNDNHHNHYPVDEYDRELLKADKNPMELFESIQALARSLHEDADLFGSLPPKRLLESPIRSLAFA